MSRNAIRWDGHSPLLTAAKTWWQARGKLFSGAPPMSDYYSREWLVAISTVLRRPLTIEDLTHLYDVKKESVTLGGRRNLRVIFHVFGDQHVESLGQLGILRTIRQREDVSKVSALVPVSKCNESALVERLASVAQSKKGNNWKRWPRKRRTGTVPFGEKGPWGGRKEWKARMRHRR